MYIRADALILFVDRLRLLTLCDLRNTYLMSGSDIRVYCMGALLSVPLLPPTTNSVFLW
jgi:hypothetical protein